MTGAGGGQAGVAEVRLLGKPTITGPAGVVGVRGEQPALVLAALCLERPRPLPVAELGELLWGGPFHSPGVLRQVVSRLRSQVVAAGLPGTAITSRAGVVAIGLDRLEIDVEVLLDDVRRAEGGAATPPSERWDLAVGAIRRSRTPLLPGIDAPYLDVWRSRLATFRRRALWAASEAAAELGRPVEAAGAAREALADDELDERATRQLMRALALGGDRAEALATYERCRRRLDDQLGVRPSAATEAVYLELLGEAPAPAPAGLGGGGRPGGRSSGGHGAVASPFVGRGAELEAADAAWRRTLGGGGQVLVVTGEPGIGKSRLAAEIAERTGAAGALTAIGRCRLHAGAPLQPVDELVHAITRERPDVLGHPEIDRAALLGHLGASEPDDSTRRRAFHAVTVLVHLVAGDGPVVLVVDDLHWAGPDAVALLDQLIWAVRDDPCLVVLTSRDPAGAGAALLADLERRSASSTLRLAGLRPVDVEELLVRGPGRVTGDLADLAVQVAARTAGNPLYLTQVIGSTRAGAPYDPSAVPAGVSELLELRVAALDPPTGALLRLAAVAGPRVEVELLLACSGLGGDDVVDHVERLCAERLLEEVGAEEVGFVHELVRDAVLARTSALRLRQLHAHVGSYLADAGADPARVAHHLRRGGPTSAAAAAVWSIEAGEAALARGAWEAALEHLSSAGSAAAAPGDRGRALIGAGRAARALGRPAEARAVLEEATALAHELHQPAMLAEATLALVGGGGRGVALAMPDAERAALLRAALDGVGPQHPELLVALLGELARCLALTDRVEERHDLCDEAVGVARRSGRPSILAAALVDRRMALMGPSGTAERLLDGLEVLSHEPDLPTDLRLAAHLGRVEDLLELGDRAGAGRHLQTAAELAARHRHPYWSWATAAWGVTLEVLDGDLARAEELAVQARAHQPDDHPEATAALGVQLVNIRLLQGRPAEVLPMLAVAADANPHIPCYAAVLALCHAEAGDAAAARAVLDRFRHDGFRLPADSNWLLGTTVLADCSATLGDVEAARVLLGLLAPWSERHAVLNCYGGGGAWWGPVSHQLARLARLVGDDDGARAYRDQAVEAARRVAGPSFGARVERQLEGV